MTDTSPKPRNFAQLANQVDVLLVDDERDMLDIISDSMNTRGIRCVTATNGEQALAAYRKLSPKLIVSDYNMPGLNGIELFRFLRDIGNRAPVIWLTGNSTPQIQKEAFLRGVLTIFQKPFQVEELVKHCQQYLKMTPKQLIELRPKFLAGKIFQNVSIDIDSGLYRKLRDKCIASSTSISGYISELIENALK